MRDPDRGRLGHRGVADRRRLELRRPDPLARDVERVVGAAVQVPVAVGVDGCPVAVRPHVRKPAPVGVEVALVVAPDPAGHPGPGPPADELADLAADGAAFRVEDVHVHPEGGEAERHGLDGLGHAGGEEAGSDLRPARDVDDRRPAPADLLVQPQVRAEVPRLAGRRDRLQRGEVGLRVAAREEGADEGG